MNFLKFPYLVQLEILQNMDYSELFLLSLTSKKTTKLISTVRHKELNRIIYYPNPEFLHIHTKNENGYNIDILRIFPKKSVEKERIVDVKIDGVVCGLVRHEENLPDRDPEKDFGLVLPVYPNLVFPSDDYEEQIVGPIHNQLNTIFGHEGLKYELEDITYRKGQRPWLPKCIKFSKSHLCFESEVDAQNLNNWFNSQSKQEFLKIRAKFLNGHLNTNSSICKADTLMVGSMFNFEIVAELLINCKNRAAFVDCVYSKNEDIIQFVNRWKSKNHHLELETLRVYLHRPHFFGEDQQDNRIDPFNIELIKKDAGLKEFPFAAQTIPLYPSSIYPRICPSLDRDVTLSSYIVRDDGIVALASITDLCFAMEVQKFTEDEMLAGKGDLTDKLIE